jgi:formate dehydrogenase iron-sulfur subunit
MTPAILTDVTKCVGCEACALACKEVNDLPRESSLSILDADTWTAVEQHGDVHVRRQCMHCLDPSCVSVCPVGALQKTDQGPVVYDASRCMGCRYCMIGCPFNIPKYEWDETRPRVQKCVMCFEKRLSEGREPACTAACPTGATIFGDRDDLLREAHARIAAEPDRYVDHVYGETEAGGTSVLYLSGVPFEQIGLASNVRSDPYPKLTWNVLSRLPNVVSIAGVTLAGIWWITGRRDAVREAEAREGEKR